MNAFMMRHWTVDNTVRTEEFRRRAGFSLSQTLEFDIMQKEDYPSHQIYGTCKVLNVDEIKN
jgi:hypothetical protein